jgi:hypothetical protein
MDKRSKKKVSAKEEQQRYDSFWNQKDFKLSKPLVNKKGSARVTNELLGSQNEKDNLQVNLPIEKKFVFTTCLEEMEAEPCQLGPRTLTLFDEIYGSQKGQTSLLKKEAVLKKFTSSLSRFLLLSRTYGWDKKYRPSRLDQVLVG